MPDAHDSPPVAHVAGRTRPDLTPSLDTALAVEEFRQLRATIRERGTWRVILAVGGISMWALLWTLIQAWSLAPLSMLGSLLILTVTFEGVFGLHAGVERIGRYLAVKYEGHQSGPGWEQAVEAFGRRNTETSGRVDPLLSVLFLAATLLNGSLVLIAVGLWGITAGGLTTGARVELVVYGILHLLAVARILRAQRFSRRQRAHEQALFSALINSD